MGWLGSDGTNGSAPSWSPRFLSPNPQMSRGPMVLNLEHSNLFRISCFVLGFIGHAEGNLTNDGHQCFLDLSYPNGNRSKRRKRSSATSSSVIFVSSCSTTPALMLLPRSQELVAFLTPQKRSSPALLVGFQRRSPRSGGRKIPRPSKAKARGQEVWGYFRSSLRD